MLPPSRRQSSPIVNSRAASTPCQTWTEPRSSHNAATIHRPNSPLCGSRGKQRTPHPRPTYFSKTPHLHSRDLEIRAACQPPASQPLGKVFHFSGSTTGITAFYLYLFPKTQVPVAPARTTSTGSLPLQTAPIRSQARPIRVNSPGIQTSTLFSTHAYGARMNTIKKKKRSHFHRAAMCCRVWPAWCVLQSCIFE